MKLTVTELSAYDKAGKSFTRISFESEPVVTDSSNNYFSMTQRKLTKVFETAVANVMFAGAQVGSVIEGWAIRTKHSFLPDNSLAQEAAKKITKVQNYSFSKNTGKMYLSDGKPFFAKLELRKEGTPEAADYVFPNITSVPALAGMVDGTRPTPEQIVAAGYAVDQSTIDKLNQPLAAPAPAVANPAARVEAAQGAIG